MSHAFFHVQDKKHAVFLNWEWIRYKELIQSSCPLFEKYLNSLDENVGENVRRFLLCDGSGTRHFFPLKRSSILFCLLNMRQMMPAMPGIQREYFQKQDFSFLLGMEVFLFKILLGKSPEQRRPSKMQSL